MHNNCEHCTYSFYHNNPESQPYNNDGYPLHTMQPIQPTNQRYYRQPTYQYQQYGLDDPTDLDEIENDNNELSIHDNSFDNLNNTIDSIDDNPYKSHDLIHNNSIVSDSEILHYLLWKYGLDKQKIISLVIRNRRAGIHKSLVKDFFRRKPELLTAGRNPSQLFRLFLQNTYSDIQIELDEFTRYYEDLLNSNN